jgi:hypothetical protein
MFRQSLMLRELRLSCSFGIGLFMEESDADSCTDSIHTVESASLVAIAQSRSTLHHTGSTLLWSSSAEAGDYQRQLTIGPPQSRGNVRSDVSGLNCLVGGPRPSADVRCFLASVRTVGFTEAVLGIWLTEVSDDVTRGLIRGVFSAEHFGGQEKWRIIYGRSSTCRGEAVRRQGCHSPKAASPAVSPFIGAWQ